MAIHQSIENIENHMMGSCANTVQTTLYTFQRNILNIYFNYQCLNYSVLYKYWF